MTRIIFCPICKSTDISIDARLEIVYHVCKSCNYRSIPGAEFPVKIIKLKKPVSKRNKHLFTT